MLKKPLSLSIVIPVYNEERYIDACLRAIAAQSEMPDEVVVVDNNSTDKTIKIAKKYNFVKLTYEKRQGIAFARNSGFDAATSDIVGRIDADTIIASDWVWQTKEYFESNPSICAVTGSCYFYDFPFKRGFHWGSNMAIRKVNWRKVKPTCNTVNGIHEDIDLTLCLHRQKQVIGRNNKMKAHVSLRRGNLKIRSLNHYLAAWHTTYLKNGLYIQAVFILLLEALTLLSALILLPFRVLAKIR
jgi:glycosyltransferase involved in cell wall biosynthesis